MGSISLSDEPMIWKVGLPRTLSNKKGIISPSCETTISNIECAQKAHQKKLAAFRLHVKPKIQKSNELKKFIRKCGQHFTFIVVVLFFFVIFASFFFSLSCFALLCLFYIIIFLLFLSSISYFLFLIFE